MFGDLLYKRLLLFLMFQKQGGGLGCVNVPKVLKYMLHDAQDAQDITLVINVSQTFRPKAMLEYHGVCTL